MKKRTFIRSCIAAFIPAAFTSCATTSGSPTRELPVAQEPQQYAPLPTTPFQYVNEKPKVPYADDLKEEEEELKMSKWRIK